MSEQTFQVDQKLKKLYKEPNGQRGNENSCFLTELNSGNLHIGEKGDAELLILAKMISRNKNTQPPLHIFTFR